MNPNKKPKIKINSSIFETIDQNKIDVRKSKSRIYYETLLTLKFEPPVALVRWREETTLNDQVFFNSFVYTKSCTKNTHLIVFNYKVINRIINTNSNLYKWKIKNEPFCNHCSENKIDDVMHSLVDCNWTYNKLKIILDELDPYRKWSKNLNWKTWLFGVAENALNLILLIIK